MTTEPQFSAWIEHLPAVTDAIRAERDKLLSIATEAAELEQRALALRRKVGKGQTALMLRVLQEWTLEDIQNASAASADADAPLRASVEDPGLRDRLTLLTHDGMHLGVEALQVFDEARVIRQHNLLSTASDNERRETLGRVIAWWNLVARPVCERLAQV